MSELQGLKKAELSNICRKIGVHVLAKDTKKALLEKLGEFIEKNPEEGLAAVQNSLEEDSDVETLAEGETENGEEEEEEEEAVEDDVKDEDYTEGPPVNLKEWIVDPLIEKFEVTYSKVLSFTDTVGITVLEYNEELRENLSTTVTLNYLELISEFFYFIYYYVPIVAVKDNNTIPSIVKESIPFLDFLTLPSVDLIVFLQRGVLAVLFTWLIAAVAVPLIISYYVNFTRRIIVIDEEDTGLITRAYQFDPFIFALAKVLVFYVVSKNGALFTTSGSYWGFIESLKNFILAEFGQYHRFTQILGNFPLVFGLANAFIALYSQFEEY